MRTYYTMDTNKETTDITIYGDITSFPRFEGDVSAYLLSKKIEGIQTNQINVYINSYGGELAEGLAIYSALKRHKAKVTTYCDGFACSAASLIFMAGDDRVMGTSSLLMIHNVSCMANGNANDLRKCADELELMSEVAANAYREKINIDDAELKRMLDAETWISPQEAVNMGFATWIFGEQKSETPAASVKKQIFSRMRETYESKEFMALYAALSSYEAILPYSKEIALDTIDTLLSHFKEEKKEQNKKTFLDTLMCKKEKKNDKH